MDKIVKNLNLFHHSFVIIKKNNKNFMIKKETLISPLQIIKKLKYLENSKEENLFLLSINKKLELINIHKMHVGHFHINLIDPKHIIYRAIKDNAKGLILVHNHPSQKVESSQQDRYLTKYLKKVCALLGIKLIDHIIIAKNKYFSFKEKKLI